MGGTVNMFYLTDIFYICAYYISPKLFGQIGWHCLIWRKILKASLREIDKAKRKEIATTPAQQNTLEPNHLKCLDNVLDHFLGIGQEHHRVISIEQIIINASITRR